VNDRLRLIYRPPWRIEITQRDGVPRLVADTRLAAAIQRALAAAATPAPATIGVILTRDEEIATLNASHMGHQGPTDVLSFPLLPPSAFPGHPGKADAAARPAGDFVNPGGRRAHLGEIVISVERAIEQATEGRGGHTGDVRWSPADELRLLVTHGVLHICGWDHADPVEERAMRALEDELLEGQADR
jgi:probable rRNA maturation factor